MQLLQIANKVTRCVSLLTICWETKVALQKEVRRLNTAINFLSDDLERVLRRVESLERTESRYRQAVS